MNSVLSFLPDKFPHFSQLYGGREDLACNRQHPSPVLKSQHVGSRPTVLKRKRTDSMEVLPKRQQQDFSVATDIAVDPASGASTPSVISTQLDSPRLATSSTVVKMDLDRAVLDAGKPTVKIPEQPPVVDGAAKPSQAATETKAKNSVIDQIGAHLDLQILLKHEELRFIETEMAKCQIALEQLRRVHSIPYPDSSASHELNYSAATSPFPALAPQAGLSQPSNPPPMGVIDGPYTRHYARWLLPDAQFDAAPPRAARGLPGSLSAPTRKRAMLEEVETPKPKRASTSMFQQLPVATGMAKALIVQRPGGKWVKIICKLCGKDDSANLQGFTNHTRIKHGIVYPTHLDAMNDCGHELSEEEAARADAVAGSNNQQLQSTTPVVSTPVVTNGPLVHPLTVGSSRQSPSAIKLQTSLAAKPRKPKAKSGLKTPPINSPAMSSDSSRKTEQTTQFVPYLKTPNLSKLLEKRGSSINLHNVGSSATQRIDLSQIETIDDDEDVQPSPVVKQTPQYVTGGSFGSSRMPARAPAPAPLQMSQVVAYPETPIDTPLHESPTDALTGQSQYTAVTSSSFCSEAAGPLTAQSSIMDSTTASPLELNSHVDGPPSLSPEGTMTNINPGLIPDDEEEDDHTSDSNHSDRDDVSTTSAQFHVQDEQDMSHAGTHNSYIFHAYDPTSVHKSLSMTDGHGNATFAVLNSRPTFRSSANDDSQHKKKRGRPRKSAP